MFIDADANVCHRDFDGNDASEFYLKRISKALKHKPDMEVIKFLIAIGCLPTRSFKGLPKKFVLGAMTDSKFLMLKVFKQ